MTTHTVTFPNGTFETRRSHRPYQFAVVTRFQDDQYCVQRYALTMANAERALRESMRDFGREAANVEFMILPVTQ